jgi:hypothetical protein
LRPSFRGNPFYVGVQHSLSHDRDHGIIFWETHKLRYGDTTSTLIAPTSPVNDLFSKGALDLTTQCGERVFIFGLAANDSR